MEKMSYNDRVKSIAEEMASSYNDDRTWSSHIRWKDRREAAEISVEKMAEAFRAAYVLGYFVTDSSNRFDMDKCEDLLFEYGLMPDKPE